MWGPIKSEVELIFRRTSNPHATLLFSSLPPCIIMPTNAMSLIAVFRNAQLLARENQWKIVGGNLARTGMGNTVDMTLSCFPKLMADAAACRVLMYFWAKASPKELIYVEKSDKSLSSSSTPAAELVDVSKQAMVARASSSYLKETNTKATVSAESTTGTNALDYGSKQPRNTERACKVFKHVVLCVWRAFCVPEVRFTHFLYRSLRIIST